MRTILLCHIIAFVTGFLLDLLLGDPHWLPHPVRLIGKLISVLEARLLGDAETGLESGGSALRTPRQKRARGVLLVIVVCASSSFVAAAILVPCYIISPILGCVIEAVMTYQMLATKCLKDESMKVYRALETGTLDDARRAVSMIVGRDTAHLTDEEVTKAAVETVAENTSDGVIAPMLYFALGGPVLGFFYKAVNTMDSMVGYKNERYIDFGRCAAKTDDVLNFLPARISAFLMIAACPLLGRDFNARNAFRIYKRDRLKHESPNSAHTESVCAGALGIRLAGPASYGGIVEEKSFLGDDMRPFGKIEHKDIIRSNRLLYAASFLCELVCAGLLIAFWQVFGHIF
ncbi:MAG: adenosylcobinamide-phosphate synthase CbiB [Treponemataceae bacterium]|nr:adenosylcobinamide-phosphate synthase CbiB [Treponemataceae bacterium]